MNLRHLKSFLIFIAAALFYSCASNNKAIPSTVEVDGEEMDAVSAVVKLAPEMCVENPSRSRVELFTSIYPSHLEPLVSSMENDVPALIKDFVSETGAASQRQAIRNRFTALPSDSFITDDERIQKVFSDSELVLENLYKLQTVQDAVAPVPEKIIVSEGEKKTFQIEKISGDASAVYKKSRNALSEFYYDVAEIQFSAKTLETKLRLFALYEKAMSYSDSDPGLAKNVRMSRLATDIGDVYLAMGSFEDRETGLAWYKKSFAIYEDYPKTPQKIAAICFELGRDMLKAATVEEDNLRMSELLEKAAQYLEDAGSYKNAAELLIQVREMRRMNRQDADHIEENEESGN